MVVMTVGDMEAPTVVVTLQPDARHYWVQQQRRDEHAREHEKGPASELAATADLRVRCGNGG